ncbi:26S proteasome regulatory complex non-ATPase subcomplex Rpn1 subunit [Dacryopinax primogenitus]|uniref:26S proteasome regulatory subunit RPN1 n=1 Tax=Dacryopinax primogenitus (strain DJM 731) TaxID=1858805 RepID=M5G0H5_DACPD|nr:26S proteasome regulatory complex non-ATPase subcomplex Rpn1 subunit [Dacryopinax primogenitus]EJT99331.1 26S proteasome regulatory complex non-ATPase subcomplex Rpn1 subunit [Dacryopinax primogenitus]
MPIKEESTIVVHSEDPVKKKEKEKEKLVDGKDDKAEGEDLSEEDLQLRNELEMLVERLREPDHSLYRPALETMRVLIRTSTSSMTSVPKPLKFLRPHYPELQELYEKFPGSVEDKGLFADILSVLSMTYSTPLAGHTTLSYRLDSPHPSAPGDWGHEYVLHLASELGTEYSSQVEKGTSVSSPEMQKLVELAEECAKWFLGHNAEADAVDLLSECECVEKLVHLVDNVNYARVGRYMVSCVNLLIPPDDIAFLRTAHDIYFRQARFPDAMALAVRLNDANLVRSVFNAPANVHMKQQLAFIIARSQIPIVWLAENPEETTTDEVLSALPDDLVACLTNTTLTNHFKAFGKELGVTDPRSLEDIYKSHLEPSSARSVPAQGVDSARQNLAGTFVNAFVNVGFGNEKMMVDVEGGQSWIYKNKDHGMMSAAASLGASLLWDTEVGLTHIDKYTYSNEEYIKAGAFMAMGILHTSVRTEIDAPLALLSEQIENKSVPLRTGAIVGLGFAYASTHRADIMALLLPLVADETLTMSLAALAALSLGFVFVGSCNGEIAGTILQTMMERDAAQLTDKWARFMALGLALLYLGRQEAADATIETLRAIEHSLAKQAQILVDICAYAGTSNVLKVQQMLHYCTDHITKEDKKEEAPAEPAQEEGAATQPNGTNETAAPSAPADGTATEEKKEEEKKEDDDTFQAFAVLGIALVAMGEDVGAEMSLRTFNHLMHYGEPIIRKAIPLALGLLSTSNPQLPLLDTLSKYSHDSDLDVAANAIFAMGLIGAGTNNARLAQMLRQLAGYYGKEPDCLFVTRVAQGLVHAGKGTVTLNPFYQDRGLMSLPAVAGILATLIAFTDAKAFVLDKSHWMLYYLILAMYPRFFITLDEELNPLPITVRVGQAVDVVGQAGKPRTISGFQTYQTPVRLATAERAELATEEYLPYASVLEGLVILEKNPGWEDEKMDL